MRLFRRKHTERTQIEVPEPVAWINGLGETKWQPVLPDGARMWNNPTRRTSPWLCGSKEHATEVARACLKRELRSDWKQK